MPSRTVQYSFSRSLFMLHILIFPCKMFTSPPHSWNFSRASRVWVWKLSGTVQCEITVSISLIFYEVWSGTPSLQHACLDYLSKWMFAGLDFLVAGYHIYLLLFSGWPRRTVQWPRSRWCMVERSFSYYSWTWDISSFYVQSMNQN